jgi:DNA helicase II / ATP-dependent DNA helicase PcrA
MTTSLEDKFNNMYKGLNKAQKEAVDTLEGPVMVVAGPGTGKTQILATRIANILDKTDTKPDEILCLTFTNSGVIAMREKLANIIGDVAYRINIFTFHSFCEHLIKEFPFYFGELSGAHVVSDLERVEILESILKRNKFKELISFHDEFSFLGKIADGILAIKKEGLTPDEFIAKLPKWKQEMLTNDDIYYKKAYREYKKGDIKPAEAEKIEKKIARAGELADMFSQYQDELKKRGLYDFSDMILYVLHELKTNADFKADIGEKYQHILVDEHQDTNEGQNEIIELLTDAPHLDGRPNIFTVGDEKQSIYRFQGASADTFSHFEKLYTDTQFIKLTENYRSTQHILDGTHSLIIKSPDHEGAVQLHSNKQEDEPIQIRAFSNYKFELLFLAEDIKSKISSGVAPSEIAVLYRANKNVADIKTIFDYQSIPYTIFSQDNILEDANIRNLLHILKVIHNPNDDHSLGKVLFAQFLNFDAYDVVQLLDTYKALRKEEKKHIFAICNDKKLLQSIEIKHSDTFTKFITTIKELKIDSENNSFLDFFKIFLDKIGYMKYMLSATDSRLQFAKLDKLVDEIKRQASSKKNYSLADFIYFIDSFTKYGLDIKSTDPEIVEGVSLMTAHGSKGREFEYVYIIGATHRGWEARRSPMNAITLPIYQYDGDIADERRLFYVAMTRAKKELAISFSRTDNDGREHEESQFVREIDASFVEVVDTTPFEEKNIDTLAVFMSSLKKSATLFDADYIRQLFFTRGLNVSALNNYLDCPMKYLYRNLIRIPDLSSPAQQYGNVIDIALNNFFKRSKLESQILPKKVLLEEFETALLSYNLDEKEEDKFRERGEKALVEYYDEYADTWTPRVETQFYVKKDFLLENRDTVQLSGLIDKIEYLDDDFTPHINVIDHKTGKAYSEKTKEQKEAYERQLVFYKLLLEGNEKYDFTIEKSMLDFVEKNKKGNFEQYSFDITREHIEKLHGEINMLAHEVLSLEFLDKGCQKKDCEWCKIGK